MSTPPTPPDQPYQQPAYYPPQPQGYLPQGGYPPQPGYPPPFAPKPPKRRPSAAWFVVGAALLVLAVGSGVGAGITIAKLMHTDGYVEGTTATTIVLDRSGKHMLFNEQDISAPTCVVKEGSTTLPLTEEDSSESIDNGRGTWVPFASFTTSGTQVEVTCAGNPNTVRVGAPAGRDQFLQIGIWVVGAIALGLLGLVELVIVAVLFFSRPSRKVTG